jgi:hypothetical protein
MRVVAPVISALLWLLLLLVEKSAVETCLVVEATT